jgi:hypothetical protein
MERFVLRNAFGTQNASIHRVLLVCLFPSTNATKPYQIFDLFFGGKAIFRVTSACAWSRRDSNVLAGAPVAEHFSRSRLTELFLFGLIWEWPCGLDASGSVCADMDGKGYNWCSSWIRYH